jgi:dolichyl-phosphate-mannose--protein O-mannosyl transferase
MGSVKMVGLFLVAAIGVAVLVDLWSLFDIRRGLEMVKIIVELSKLLTYAFVGDTFL